jgi:hypothetical protein
VADNRTDEELLQRAGSVAQAQPQLAIKPQGRVIKPAQPLVRQGQIEPIDAFKVASSAGAGTPSISSWTSGA